MNVLRPIFLVLTVAFFFAGSVSALHIIGGDFSYECLGNDNYEITLNVYRDCFSQGGALLDNPAFITIFRGGTPATQFGFSRQVPLDQQGFVPAETDNPCLVPPSNVCVEFGTYTFTTNLPAFAAGYHIVYQRCCRNTTISNIVTPGEVGATYTMFISSEAQQSCNNSPVFNDFPPIAICAGEPLSFDHSATDAEGDELIYELCRPTTGASSMFPIPEVATTPAVNFPHYPTVNYISPYSETDPLGGNPPVTIHPTTGLITGIPTIQGQFVVGVCVYEYRNGELLSITRRDFQFNVTNCERSITADIREDSLGAGYREYIVNSCGNNTITFVNESQQVAFIEGYYWEFETGLGIESTTATNPTITFNGIGEYEGILIVNPDSPDCADTANIFVNIYPDIQADFNFVIDSCDNVPIQFSDQSTTGSGMITNWNWNFGDGNTSTTQSPNHSYTQAGNFNINLTVRDINQCEDTYTQNISWFPESQINISIENANVCAPATVEFINNSFPINGYTTEWDLGDGTTSTEISPTHTYPQPGNYTITLTMTSPTGCVSSEVFSDYVRVLAAPNAAFSCTPENPTNFAPEVTFTDQSTDAVAWSWDFGTGDNSGLQNPIYAFPDTGRYEVQLIATHQSGCQDSTSKFIDVQPRYTYHLPNAFTPNYDDVNDGFRGAGLFYGIETFNMTIWNRWGELVFETNDPNIAWNGRKYNTGHRLPLGVYVYHVRLTGARGMEEELTGYVTLVR